MKKSMVRITVLSTITTFTIALFPGYSQKIIAERHHSTQHRSGVDMVNSEDTLHFSSARELREYFGEKQRALDSQYKKVGKQSSQRNVIDSIQFALNTARAAASLQMLRIKGVNASTFEAMNPLVVDRQISIDKLDSIYLLYTSNLKTTPAGRFHAEQLKKRKAQEKITSFNTGILRTPIQNQLGAVVELQTIDAPYLLVDFWTSWCIPCRKLNREMSGIQSQIEANGKVKVVLLSLDAHRENWRKAVAVDKLSFIHLWEPKQLESPITRELGITKFPHNVLIDKQGKIHAINLHGEALLAAIAKLP